MAPFFQKSHGKPRFDDRLFISGIIFITRNDLRWRDAPTGYAPHKTLWRRWSGKGMLIDARGAAFRPAAVAEAGSTTYQDAMWGAYRGFFDLGL